MSACIVVAGASETGALERSAGDSAEANAAQRVKEERERVEEEERKQRDAEHEARALEQRVAVAGHRDRHAVRVPLHLTRQRGRRLLRHACLRVARVHRARAGAGEARLYVSGSATWPRGARAASTCSRPTAARS